MQIFGGTARTHATLYILCTIDSIFRVEKCGILANILSNSLGGGYRLSARERGLLVVGKTRKDSTLSLTNNLIIKNNPLENSTLFIKRFTNELFVHFSLVIDVSYIPG